ncbi:hypothetical protein [Candidatus Symbiopectobacterium sp.]|uniref:hypothetical protein n=1 Tax=Candidatus Symbiopectobacterium sp. TaxID=2816440 RepID=UPI0025C4C476|nr:hypothetical protein [Candidatus Symbiopectobacterium sp.]
MSERVSKKKVLTFFLSIAISAAAAYYGQPSISDNSNAINVLVTMYSVLAGILIAIISVMGDPSVLDSGGSWRRAYLSSKLPKARLTRTKILFHIYLITLFLIFVSYLVPKVRYPQLRLWVEYFYVFFASMALILSFKLPSTITDVQRARLDKKILEQRKKDGIID